jgi:uncharacterized Ntn-hydrolase superfamily protein
MLEQTFRWSEVRVMKPSTFSIVAADQARGEVGVAVASKFLAVGAVVPFARAETGAVATQAAANTAFGPRALDLLASGLPPEAVTTRLVQGDSGRDHRQFGIVNAAGQSSTYTGAACNSWAGGTNGPGFAAQGNILTAPEVVAAMVSSFVAASGPLPDRLLAALAAGQDAGGDSRGQQSAAIVVVKTGGGYGGFNDRYVDLRVDDHPNPVDELMRLRGLHRLYFERSTPEDAVPLTTETVVEIQLVLRRAGQKVEPSGRFDAVTKRALESLYGQENLEERWRDDEAVDAVALEYLRITFGASDPGK